MTLDSEQVRLRDRALELVARFVDLVRRPVQSHRRAAALVAYAFFTTIGYGGAWLIVSGLGGVEDAGPLFLVTLPLLLAVRLLSDLFFKLSTGRWRFVSVGDAMRLAVATTVGSVVFLVAARLLPLPGAVPLTVVILEWVFTAYITAGVWIGYRTLFEQIRHYRSGYNGSARRVLIVGAGEAGNMLAREMLRFPTGYRPVGFVDDDPNKWGTRLYGLEVLGSTQDMPSLARSVNAAEVAIAIPSATPQDLQKIVAACELAALPFRVLPGIAEVLEGKVQVTQLREIRIEDLLGRPAIDLDLGELDMDLRGRCVLITGAAGSIGGELARQVAKHGPSRLVLFDQAETELFFLEMELRDRFPDVSLTAVVGDIIDVEGVELLFEEYSPDRVFHAAAYKHVPVMEANAREAVRNNVVGTLRIAEASGRHGAGKFVLVSTDKAAQPASVMGATKRLAEMLVLEMHERHPETVYTAVRFGNVLGSNGSVIPIFEKQLRAGKPLTVTHPDATRYFMTITEAVQLILQTSLLPELGGSIGLLEMGEPIRVMDLATNMLRLSGVPGRNGDRIVFTGLRPGEKLHEKLTAPDEETRPTAVPQVRLIKTQEQSDFPLVDYLREWKDGAVGDETTVVEWLLQRFPGLRVDPVKRRGTGSRPASVVSSRG
jgi:FlaA1/EpsC-like NDP-sugar epimerase